MANISKYEIIPPIIVPQPDLLFNNMNVQVININLGISATFNVFLFNDTTMMTTRTYTMSGEDYANWGSDDSYVYTWIIAQLQLSA